MSITAASSLHELVDDMFGSGLIRVAHTEIDDILTGGAGLLLEIANNIKNVWRQSLDTPKLIIHGC